MKIFLSYASEQRRIAEEINAAIATRDHDVFFDQSDLRAGLDYNLKIQREVQNCDLFVFLISPDSIREGSYTLTELSFVKDKWKNPSGRILPVMAVPTLITDVDAYLRAVSVLFHEGNLAARVAAEVDDLLNPDRPTHSESDVTLEVLRERIGSYKELWEITQRLLKWPRATGVSYDDLRDLSKSLRAWYFTDGGGMFLSRAAHTAYSALQDSMTAILIESPSGNITNEHYDAVRELCSGLRTTLARDVGART